MESSKPPGRPTPLTSITRVDVAPRTWDQVRPPAPEGTEETPAFEPADFGDSERTLITTSYELRPRFTGRSSAIARLQELIDKAFDDRELAFAVITGEPGM